MWNGSNDWVFIPPEPPGSAHGSPLQSSTVAAVGRPSSVLSDMLVQLTAQQAILFNSPDDTDTKTWLRADGWWHTFKYL